MGQNKLCSFKHDNNPNHADLGLTMSKNNFDFKYVIGRGGFGKVSIQSKLNSDINIGMESRIPQD